MLVSTMTPDEITREIESDQAVVFKSLPKIFNEYDRERRKYKIGKEKIYTRLYEMKSKKKNNWIFMLSKIPSNSKYAGAESVALISLTYYYSSKGFRVFRFDRSDGWMSVYNGHFFKRYNERMNLGINNLLDVVKYFFANYDGSEGIITPKEDRDFGITVCKDGFLLGERRNQIKWSVFNTFITRDLSGDDQDEIEGDLILRLRYELEREKYIKDNLDINHHVRAQLLKNIEAQKALKLKMLALSPGNVKNEQTAIAV